MNPGCEAAIYNNTSTSSSCTLPTTSKPKLDSSTGYSLKYLRNDFKYYSTPLVLDVVGDPYPEIFVLSPLGSEICSPTDIFAELRALQLVNGQLQDLWTLSLPAFPRLTGIGQIAVAKVPNTNESIICAYTTLDQFLCADAASGATLFVQNRAGIDYCLNLYPRFSSIAIEKISQSSDDLFILTTEAVYKYDPQLRSASLYCSIPSASVDILAMPYAADIDGDGQAELLYLNCVYSSTNCSQLWCGVDPPAAGCFTTAIANMDDDPYAEV